MKKRTISIIIFLLLFIVIIASSLVFFNESKMMKRGDLLIEKVEEFRYKNNRLPVSLNELEIEENIEGPLFYEKLDSTENYLIWYGTILGESVTYDSSKKEWNK
tara:strand:+ start:1522 stop:1833 length:312 start_codon:yes stop_codon:yes gene_type:complete